MSLRRWEIVFPTLLFALAIIFLLPGCSQSKPDDLLASAKQYMVKQEYRAAAIQLKNFIDRKPDSAEARYLLGKALLELGDPAAEVELRKARDLKYPIDTVMVSILRFYLNRGEYKRVIDEAKAVIATTPEGTAQLLTQVSTAHALMGDPVAAESAIARALEAKPGYAPALVNRARILMGTGKLSEARAMVDAVVGKDSMDAEAWKFKGDLLSATQEIEPALDAYRTAVKIRADYLPAYFGMATLLLSAGRTDEAAKMVGIMKKLAPASPMTQMLQSQLAYAAKDYTNARDMSQRLLKSIPNDPTALRLAGMIEYQLKSYDQAENMFARALTAAPESLPARRGLAVTYSTTGQYGKLLGILTPVISSFDNDAEMLALAGEAFLRNGDIPKAEQLLSRATTLAPNDSNKRTALAMTKFAKGDTDLAILDLEQISVSDTGVTADLALVSALMRKAQWNKALSAIDIFEKKRPADALPAFLRGTALLSKRDFAGARKSLEHALTLVPSHLRAASALAAIDLLEKKPDSARKRYESVIAADPKSSGALVGLAELAEQGGASVDDVAALYLKAISAQPEDPTPRSALTMLYLRSKQVGKAIAAGQDAVAVLPNRPEPYLALGQAQREAGEFNQALATYNKLAKLFPDWAQPHMYMAEVNLAAKNPEAAAQNMRRAMAASPSAGEMQRGLILLDQQAGKSQDALTIVRELQKLRPTDGLGFALEGDVKVSRGAWADAVEAYREGLKVAPTTSLALKLYASLIEAGKRSEAERLAQNWIKERPNDQAFRVFLAENAATRKDYVSAASQFQALVLANPDDPVLLNNLAWVAGQIKQPQAIEYAEKANRIAPNRPAYMSTLATLLAEKGEYARAVSLLEKAIEIAPDLAENRLELARILVQAGRKSEAKPHLELLSRLGDKFVEQKEVARLLSSL